MNMTFNDYIQNPMGKDNAVISNRNMYKTLYTGKLDRILVREAGKVDIKAYKVGKKYLCYLKIPSEVVSKFYYDVLVEFSPPKGLFSDKSDLKSYNVRFYSNDPSFVFTFAHAFIKNDLFIKEFSDKMSSKAVKNNAKEKNPKNQVGYVKSLYFAYIIMTRRGYFSKLKYVDAYSQGALKKEIMHADKKIELRQEAAQSKSNGDRKEKEAIKRVSSPGETMEKDIPIKPKKNIGAVGKVKATKPVKNTVKTIKKK